MIYYPKSQITSNLYTNGGEYMFAHNHKEYIGYYYKISTGKVFIGKDFIATNQIELIPLSTQDQFFSTSNNQTESLSEIEITTLINTFDSYITSSPNTSFDNSLIFSYPNNTPSNRSIPTSHHSLPSSKDTQIGEYQRYFAKKTNELIYIEVSKETYTKFNSNDPTVASDLYNVLSLPWSLDRDAESTNRKIVALVEKNNKWYGFSKYFKDNFTS